MTEVEKRDVAEAAEEGEKLLMEGMAVLDFDMLCSAVAMQAQSGKWGKLSLDDDEEDCLVSDYQQYGGTVHRMWEGELVYDCFDDRGMALQSTCCPCYRFGKNMKRAGLGSCFIQGSIHLILVSISLFGLLAFIITRRPCFIYLAISFAVSLTLYLGYCRMKIRNKFNIKGGDSWFDDFVYHLICPCCTLCQESRTLEMNNVQDGIWHGRGDTICIGSLSKVHINPPSVVSISSPNLSMMQKTKDENVLLSSPVVADSLPLTTTQVTLPVFKYVMPSADFS